MTEPVEGNRKLVACLKHWLDEAEKGKLNSIAVALSDGSQLHIDFFGLQGPGDYLIYFGVDSIKTRMADMIWGRQSPVERTKPSENVDVSKVVFNADNLTLGYDFLAFLVAAEQRRSVHKPNSQLKVAIHYGDSLKTPYSRKMRENVCLPLIRMIGAQYLSESDIGADALWPPDICFAEAVEFTKQGIQVPRFEPDQEAKDAMAEHAGAVTITLREADHWRQRNSKLNDWFEVAKWLRGRGEKVVIVRDTRKAHERFGDFKTEPEAATDIQCRAALYAVAKCNLFGSNGPSTLDWFVGRQPSLTFIGLDEHSGYKCDRGSWWKVNHGIGPGEQFPWFHGTRKAIIWERPTPESVIKAYSETMASAIAA